MDAFIRLQNLDHYTDNTDFFQKIKENVFDKLGRRRMT